MKKTLFIAFLSCLLTIISSAIFAHPVKAEENLKIGFITDWEYGKQKKISHKKPSTAKTNLKNATNFLNNTFHPDLAVGGGDYINSQNINSKQAKKDLKTISSIFKRTNTTKLYCFGNHDLSKLSKSDIQSILNQPEAHSVTDTKGFRIITLDTNQAQSGSYEVEGRVSATEMTWLDEQLNTSLPVIIFSHHSPAPTPTAGGIRANMYRASEVRALLEKHDNVVAVFSGHTPVNDIQEINGIQYIIINNLTTKTAQGSFATIEINKNKSNLIDIQVAQHGAKHTSYHFQKQMLN